MKTDYWAFKCVLLHRIRSSCCHPSIIGLISVLYTLFIDKGKIFYLPLASIKKSDSYLIDIVNVGSVGCKSAVVHACIKAICEIGRAVNELSIRL